MVNQRIIETSCLIIAGFDLFGFIEVLLSRSHTSPELHLLCFNNGNVFLKKHIFGILVSFNFVKVQLSHFTIIGNCVFSLYLHSSNNQRYTNSIFYDSCDGKLTKIPKRDFIFARVKTGQVGT